MRTDIYTWLSYAILKGTAIFVVCVFLVLLAIGYHAKAIKCIEEGKFKSKEMLINVIISLSSYILLVFYVK